LMMGVWGKKLFSKSFFPQDFSFLLSFLVEAGLELQANEL